MSGKYNIITRLLSKVPLLWGGFELQYRDIFSGGLSEPMADAKDKEFGNKEIYSSDTMPITIAHLIFHIESCHQAEQIEQQQCYQINARTHAFHSHFPSHGESRS